MNCKKIRKSIVSGKGLRTTGHAARRGWETARVGERLGGLTLWLLI